MTGFRRMFFVGLSALFSFLTVFGPTGAAADEPLPTAAGTATADAADDNGADEQPPLASLLEDTVDQAVAAEAAVQAHLDEWNDLRDTLQEEARNLKYELQWLELQQAKLARYVAANDEKIAAMEEALARYAVIAMGLESALIHDLERLEASVAAGAPFLAEERAARLRFLRTSLDDPDLHIGEKYRRFVEALNVEVDYGRRLEVTTGVGILDGEELDLVLVRAGRVGYYCLTMDRNRGGIWNAGEGRFDPLEGESLQAVKNIDLMSQTQQYYNFAVVPAIREGQ
ncbi:MAG: DUF3450 domain-containing protein [Planctomycetes bacterium]|nr:DUF3450 domain-containing protein [Planctomycetota bacterium]